MFPLVGPGTFSLCPGVLLARFGRSPVVSAVWLGSLCPPVADSRYSGGQAEP